MHRHAPIGTAIIHLFGEVVKSFPENRHNIRKRQVKSVNYVDGFGSKFPFFTSLAPWGIFVRGDFRRFAVTLYIWHRAGEYAGDFY